MCNDSHLEMQDENWTVVGSPTEGALVAVAHKAGLITDKLEQALPRLDTLPFKSQFQYMATLHGNHSEQLIYVKGSVEAILKRCRQMLDDDGGAIALNLQQIEQTMDGMAKKGLRVLALAKKVVPAAQSAIEHCDLEQGLIFLGMQGMLDPPRPEAVQALVAAEAFYLLGISRFVPTIIAKLRGNDELVSYKVAIGIACVFILQLLFSQWSVMNQLFATDSLTLSQGLICFGIGLPMIALSALLKQFTPLN